MSLTNYEEETAEQNLADMSQEMKRIAFMKKAHSDEARDSTEVAILLTSVENLFTIQQNFMKNMLTKFDELNRRQLNLLSVQGEYAKNVRDSTGKAITDIYYQFRAEQQKAFVDIRKYLANDTELMIKKVNKAAKNAEKAAAGAASTAYNIEQSEKWKVRLFYLSPAFVVLDIIIRFYLSFWS